MFFDALKTHQYLFLVPEQLLLDWIDARHDLDLFLIGAEELEVYVAKNQEGQKGDYKENYQPIAAAHK